MIKDLLFLIAGIQFFCVFISSSGAYTLEIENLDLSSELSDYNTSDSHLKEIVRKEHNTSHSYELGFKDNSLEMTKFLQKQEHNLKENNRLIESYHGFSSEDIPFVISGLVFEGNAFLRDEDLCNVALGEINILRGSQDLAGIGIKSGDECIFSQPIEVDFGLLSEIRNAIDQNLINQGYITSGSYIPEQNLSRTNDAYNAVEIRIVEGYLDRIRPRFQSITESETSPYQNEDLSEYVCGGFAIYFDEFQQSNNECISLRNEPLNQEKLIDAIEFLRADPIFSNVEANLIRENDQDILDIVLSLCNGTPNCSNSLIVEGSLGNNNNRSPGIGNNERQFQVRLFNILSGYHNVTGRPADRLTFQFNNTNGSNSLNLDLNFPLPEFGSSLTLGYGRYRGEVIEEPFNRLDLTSRSESFRISIKDIIGNTSPQHELFLNWSGEIYLSRTFILDEPFPISLLEANEDGKTLVMSMGVDAVSISRTPNRIISWVAGIEAGSNITDSQGFFLIGTGQSQLYQRITPEMFFLLRGYAQLSTSSLPSIKQLGIGGQTSVRGYRPNFLLADNGFLGSLEFQYLPPLPNNWNSSLTLVSFFDIGYGWNNTDLALPTNFVMSTGVGIQLAISDYLSAGLEYGIPLLSTSSSNENTQNLNFYVNLNF